MEWSKDNIDYIVEFINIELATGRPMVKIEIEDFGVNERVIHKRLSRLGYKKIDNQYRLDNDITRNITPIKEKKQESNITRNIDSNKEGLSAQIDMDKLGLLLSNLDKILKLIPTDTTNITSNITSLRSGTNEVRSLRLDTGLYESIKQRAARDNINISTIVNKALEDYLNNYL